MDGSGFGKLSPEDRIAIYKRVFEDGIAKNNEIRLEFPSLSASESDPGRDWTVKSYVATWDETEILSMSGLSCFQQRQARFVTMENGRGGPPNQLALTLVCKEMRREAYDTLFSGPTLSLNILPDYERGVRKQEKKISYERYKLAMKLTKRFISTVPYANLVRHVVFDVSGFCLKGDLPIGWSRFVRRHSMWLQQRLNLSAIKAVLKLPAAWWAWWRICTRHGIEDPRETSDDKGRDGGDNDSANERAEEDKNLTTVTVAFGDLAHITAQLPQVENELMSVWHRYQAIRPEETVDTINGQARLCCRLSRFTGEIHRVKEFLKDGLDDRANGEDDEDDEDSVYDEDDEDDDSYKEDDQEQEEDDEDEVEAERS